MLAFFQNDAGQTPRVEGARIDIDSVCEDLRLSYRSMAVNDNLAKIDFAREIHRGSITDRRHSEGPTQRRDERQHGIRNSSQPRGTFFNELKIRVAAEKAFHAIAQRLLKPRLVIRGPTVIPKDLSVSKPPKRHQSAPIVESPRNFSSNAS